MLYKAAMSPSEQREKKDQQMNVRFTATELAALERVAEVEDRDLAYVVGFFVRWGLEQYRRVGSFVILRNKNFPQNPHKPEVQLDALSRLRIREEASHVPDESLGNARRRPGSEPKTSQG
jgi:hypothetical protein